MEAWAIKDWDGVFERHDTRRYERLTYVCKPVGQHSIAYLRLASTDAGIMALGVFDGLVTAAAHSRSHKWRGILGDEGGEWTVSMLSSMTGMSKERIEDAIQVLSAPGVGWLVRVRCEPRAQSHTHPAHTSTHTRRTPSNTISAHTEKEKRREDEISPDAAHQVATTPQSGSLPLVLSDAVHGKPKRPQRPKDPIRWDSAQGWVGIAQSDREEWGRAYPACNLETQLAQSSAWLRANPAKAVKSNWRRFLTNWLARSQERGGDTKSNSPNHADARRDAKAATEYPEKSRIHLVRKLNSAPIPPTN